MAIIGHERSVFTKTLNLVIYFPNNKFLGNRRTRKYPGNYIGNFDNHVITCHNGGGRNGSKKVEHILIFLNNFCSLAAAAADPETKLLPLFIFDGETPTTK